MKIVHSFWSKPFTSKGHTIEKINGGWRHPKYNLMSWALSCLSFKKFYDIELVTDSYGKRVLIDFLNLPYSSVKMELDSLNKYPESLWALGKLYSYSLQHEPFIHADGDVFIWERFPEKIENARLLGQNIDLNESIYEFGVKMLNDQGISLLPELIDDYTTGKTYNATNAGIIGGSETDFFKEFVDRAFWFIDKNLNKMNASIIGSSYALIYEQYLFSVLARKKNIRVEHLVSDKSENIMLFSDFFRKYNSAKYVHMLGRSKSKFRSCRELEMQLLVCFPEYYDLINSLFAKNGKALKSFS